MTTLSEAVGGPKRVIGGPFGSKLTTRDYTDAGIPVIRGGNMEVDGRWIGGEFAFVSEDKVARDLKTNLAHPGDIIVTQRGTLGQVSIVPDESRYSRFVISQSQMAISVDRTRIDRDYLYYFLRSPVFGDYSHTQTIQTGVPHINLGILRDTPLELRPLPEQRKLARVLGALDDQIELNRRMSATLEEMARALYRSWFVDFDPVHARALGQPPAHMDATTAALFPDSFRPDGLPKGWALRPFSDQIEIISGGTPKTNVPDYWGGEIPWYSVVDAPEPGAVFVLDTEKKLTSAGFKGCAAKMIVKGTTIISARGTIGKLAMAASDMVFNQSCYGLKGSRAHMAEFVYFSAVRAVNILQSMSHGSVFSTITRKTFDGLDIVYPPDNVLEEFARQSGLMLERTLEAQRESRTLAALRDSLLPRLMSGQLRIRDAEKQVEEVV